MAPYRKRMITDFTTQSPQTSSPFLGLPAEIRNTIYKYLSSTTNVSYTLHTASQSRPMPGGKANPWSLECKPSPPSHLLVCKQMYVESIGLLYAHATFAFRTHRALVRWLVNVPWRLRDLVQQIEGPPSVQDDFRK